MRLERAALPLILLLALLLRVTSLSFGLDLDDPERVNLASRIDERGMVEAIQDGLLHGNLDPGAFFFRGPAGFLVFGAADAGLIGVHALTHAGGWKGRMAELERNPSWLHLVHRWVAALAGVVSVFVLARMLGREFGRACGLLAGLFLAVAYLSVRESHFGTVDTLFALAILLALERMLAWIRAPSRRRAFASGLLSGVATATKYFGVLLGAHLVAAHVFARRTAPEPATRRLLWWALLAAPLGFLLMAPGLFVAFGRFLGAMDWATGSYGNAGTLAALLGNTGFYVRTALWVGLGEPAFLLALAGIVLAWRRGASGRFLVLALVFLLPTLCLTSATPVRYGLAVCTLLAGFAGIGAAALLARAGALLGGLLVALCVAPSLVRSISLDRLLAQPDTRVEMLSEVTRRGLPARDVLAIGWHRGLPIPVNRSQRPYVLYGPDLQTLAAALGGDDAPDEEAGEHEPRPAPVVPGRRGRTLDDVRAHPPRLVLWDLTAPEFVPGSGQQLALVPERAALEEYLRANYHEVLRLDGRRGPTELPYEISPALMMPYEQPWEMSRPGPPLVLYERNGP